MLDALNLLPYNIYYTFELNSIIKLNGRTCYLWKDSLYTLVNVKLLTTS